MAKNPASLYFNNVTSMGISYSWENTAGAGNGIVCSGINRDNSSFVKRSKTVNLNVVNLDLNNAGGATIAQMANDQSRYVSPEQVRIYANGLFAGKGKLTNYSINEGSLSNDSVTNLTYEISNEGESFDQQDDPVQRQESITVSRDLQNKSYTIDHSYSISFGNDNDLITDHPLYKDKPSYASVEGRLALGEFEANNAIYNNPVNYSEYIDLSAYTSKNGWDLKKLEHGCSGVASSSSATKNYINGDYSLSKKTTLQYTGEDLSQEKEFYQLDYTMSWSEEERGQSSKKCAVVKLDGTIRGIAKNCGPLENASVYAESGYNKFINEGEAKDRVINFFDYIKNNIDGVPTGNIHDTIFNLKKVQCNPSVDRDGKNNDGEISFSFEMHNCENYNAEYNATINTSKNISVSYLDCGGKRLASTEVSAEISVNAGECFLGIDEDGNYPKYNSISGVIDESDIKSLATGLYNGSYPERLKIVKEQFRDSPYQGAKSYSVYYSDALKDQNCNPVSTGCGHFHTKTKITPRKPIFKDVEGGDCFEQTSGSFSPATRKVDTSLRYPPSCPGRTLIQLVNMASNELTGHTPLCAITSVNWSASKEPDGTIDFNASMEGIDGL